jgi:DNA-binding NarL/FixJ family response regulator
MIGGVDTRGPEEGTIRVLVVDDHGVVRRGMQSYLELMDDMEFVGEASDGQQALDRVASLSARGRAPDVVMMDLVMPGMDGIRATEVLKQRYPTAAAGAITSFPEVARAQAALEAGAAGYLLKDASADAVASAIRAAHRGEVHLDPRVARRLAESIRAPATATVRSLSAREREVLGLLAEGLSNQEIAQRLYISERTARTHVSSILRKLGLASRTQAALWAPRGGPPPGPYPPAPRPPPAARRPQVRGSP